MAKLELMTSRSILGPALGGALAQPVQTYPSLFAPGSLFDEYPFLLPNLVCVAILGCGLVIGILFLEETHAQHKHKGDPGIALRKWLFGVITSRDSDQHPGEHEKLLQDDLSLHRISESSDRSTLLDYYGASIRPVGVQRAFTRPVIMNIVAYGIMA